ncbi:MAG: hypothetical protein ABI970_19700, partial [Chloroflexota bacterium]
MGTIRMFDHFIGYWRQQLCFCWWFLIHDHDSCPSGSTRSMRMLPEIVPCYRPAAIGLSAYQG